MPKHVVHTSIDIYADSQKVWDVLKDFDRYPEWNPCLTSVTGERSIDSILVVSINPDYFINKRFRAKLLEYSKERGIRWYGRSRLPHIFAGNHSFEIIPTTNGVTFIQREEFSGILLPLLTRTLDKRTKKGYEEMNRALKARSEKVV